MTEAGGQLGTSRPSGPNEQVQDLVDRVPRRAKPGPSTGRTGNIGEGGTPDYGQLAATMLGPGEASTGELCLVDLLVAAAKSGRKLSPEILRSVVDCILTSGQFCRDTESGALLHPKGKIAFRETTNRHSMHVSIGEAGISVHVDRVSPLSRAQGDDNRCGHCNYSAPRVLAHLVTNLFVKVFRPGVSTGANRMQVPATRASGPDDESLTARETADPGAGSSVLARTPFTALDEAVYFLDNPVEPWTVQIEARVGGRLDEARFRRALATALALHPMARARTGASHPGWSQFMWEITTQPDVDPLRIVDCPDDEALGQARNGFYSLSIPLYLSPPLRVQLARHTEGDVVMLAVHHSAIDGGGGLRLLGSIAQAYAGVADPLPGIDPLGARDFRSLFGPRGAAERVGRSFTAAREVWSLLHAPSRLAGDQVLDRSGYGFHHRSLTREQTEALIAASGDRTLDDLLVCALHQDIEAWNREHAAPARRITVGLPVDLRPDEWHGDVVGNFLCMVAVSTMPADRVDSSKLLEAVSSRIRQVGRRHSAEALVGLFGILQRLLPLSLKPAVVFRVTGNPFAPSALIHNLGDLGELSFGDDLAVQEVWVSPPAMMPEALSIGAVTAGGRLQLSFRYRLAFWDAAEAPQFAADYIDALKRLSALPAA